ncbi:MAG: hypothetical protein HUK15_09810 [Bacteroidales bacterium]|nr:hypothetical protein [Bacteroidales bacterium]
MKKLAFLVLLTAFSAGFAKAGDFEKELKKFVNNFSKVIKAQKYEEALPFFLPEYVAEQHDSNMGGNTIEFISDFLSGQCEGFSNDIFVTPQLDQIVSIKYRDFYIANGVWVNLIVTLKNGITIVVTNSVHIDGESLYFVGALG